VCVFAVTQLVIIPCHLPTGRPLSESPTIESVPKIKFENPVKGSLKLFQRICNVLENFINLIVSQLNYNTELVNFRKRISMSIFEMKTEVNILKSCSVMIGLGRPVIDPYTVRCVGSCLER
jgi:hypothetical protein